MFDYTKVAFTKVINDFKKLFFVFNIVVQLVYIAYLCYATFFTDKFFKINLSLLAVSVIYFVVFLATRDGSKLSKKVDTTVKRSVKWYKIIVKAFTLGVALYALVDTVNTVKPLSVVLVSLMIIGWVLQVLFELVLYFLESKVDYVITGLKRDWEESSGLGRVAGNLVFNKVLGWEMQEDEKPTKKSEVLQALVKEAKAEKIKAKKEEKERKRLTRKNKG